MKKHLIEYMKKHFDYTYNYNLFEYTFFVSDLTKRAYRIMPFMKKYFNAEWEILGNTLFLNCKYFEY